MKKIKNIALAIAILMGIIGTPVYAALAQFSPDQVPSGMPFGGYIASFIPPSPVCTAHTVLFDFVTLQVIGVAVNTDSEIYRNFDLATTGKALLGTYIPAPLICAVPYPVFFISQVGTS